MEILQSLFRWIHVVAGVLWIGHLYFFNWVNGPFAATLDGETKKKVVPELMPRALFWFRWGAAWTWVTGVLLLMLVFYHGGALFNDPSRGWGLSSIIMIVVVFASPFLYDLFVKTVGKKSQKVATVVGFVLISGVVCLMNEWAGFGYRGYSIHTGVMFGTIMAFNVWFRIWPAQQKIIEAVKAGQAPDAELVAMAGLRSRQNTYFSIPLIWTMINAHTTWAAGSKIYLFAVILVAWFGTMHLYKRAGKVKGF
ncbi:MAG: urate hydroxylase PuuD [Deltaproteobacteria bacterium]|nr:urate hydroxylase PuuD [Deltaproteobacteria bacterium]